GVCVPRGARTPPPPPSRQDLDREGVEVGEERGPSLLIDGTVLVTGEIERVTAFERGLPGNQARVGAGWEPDPWIRDDQAVVAHVRGRGLVVLSGCSHAGAINVLRQAQPLTGEDRVPAFVGGMHLPAPLFEPLIPPTLDELEAIGPDWVVPGHSTGWGGAPRAGSPGATARGGGLTTSPPAGCRTPTCRPAWGRACASPETRPLEAQAAQHRLVVAPALADAHGEVPVDVGAPE